MIPKSLKKEELEIGKTVEYNIMVVNNQKTWRNRVIKNIQKPYVGEGYAQDKAQDLIEDRLAWGFDLVIIDNDAGDGLNTLDAITEFSPEIPVIYTSMMPDDPNWLSKNKISRSNVHIHHTRDTASEKVNELLTKYIGESE